MRKLLCGVAVVVLVTTYVFAFSGGSTAAGKGNAAKGKEFYAKTKCDVCHGKEGRGDGAAGKSLKPPATNFTDAKAMSKITDQQMFNVIKNGGPAEKKAATMPAYKDKLKDTEINDVVAYLRTLSKGNAAKGKEFYAKTKCDVCHGKSGKGDGPAGKSLKPPATNFTDAKAMSKITDQQMFNVIKNGGPAEKKAAAMPAYKDKLKDAGINDIVAYLRTLSKGAK